ncbi:hypothetical protein [Telmatospirillum siberiense]|uniref:Uncharacterized protein n=1 Tax=Telmatospirillum siberiense TaxID=382514 RepID=A0A2N3PNM2_9PROT|nr:hypothetical protein [Telmatospirillum siberiense]PKU21996.1 hypothetical protein CWS72_24130 [Telmatospirillum siberiense]
MSEAESVELREFRDIVDACIDIVVLVQGRTVHARDFWAYVAIPPGRYGDFKAAEASGQYRLNDWGRILRHGAGRRPPAQVHEEMARIYGANSAFEEDLDAILAD